MESLRKDIALVRPHVERDATFVFEWFQRPEGRQTLLSMGNAEHEIHESTLDGEKATLREFIELEKNDKQVTRMIVTQHKTIGAVWIDLIENHGVKSPSVHVMIGDPDFRGKGVGFVVMQSAIDYARNVLKARAVYSRHLTTNEAVIRLNEKIGFMPDGTPYTDENNLRWQNVVITFDGMTTPNII